VLLGTYPRLNLRAKAKSLSICDNIFDNTRFAATWRSNLEKQLGEATWRSNLEKQLGEATWRSNLEKQLGEATWRSNFQKYISIAYILFFNKFDFILTDLSNFG
jgi:hypothetical protein